jgi:hypothetical protein
MRLSASPWTGVSADTASRSSPDADLNGGIHAPFSEAEANFVRFGFKCINNNIRPECLGSAVTFAAGPSLRSDAAELDVAG